MASAFILCKRREVGSSLGEGPRNPDVPNMMDTQLGNTLDERGVSPVIGVILMVAITVILAAVIGSFVLGIGGDIQETPQASLSMEDAGSGNVTVTHQGGDTLQLTNYNYTVDGETTYSLSNQSGETELTPGQSIEMTAASGETTIRIIHNPSGQVIADSTVRITP